MKHLRYSYMRRILYLGMLVFVFVPLTGCEEANMAIDSILGRQSPVLSAAQQVSSQSLIPAKRRAPGEQAAPVVELSARAEHELPGEPAKKESAGSSTQQGKRRAPGQLSPAMQQAMPPAEKKAAEVFQAERNPFKAPTEVLPSECPPSMPLCRFDRSQLKLVGVIQVSEGEFKGMVEDPDGRGYFVTAGMQIGGATVTQVSNKGMTLHLHKTRQDVVMPLFKEARGGEAEY